jgi:pimeloyl-ACP methyl ester carboxylesterase
MNTPKTQTPAGDLAAFEAAVEHHSTSRSGVRIHYAALGQGPLIVCLHGFPDHWLGWRHVMAGLSGHFRVAALDMRGYNLSDQPTELSAYEVRHLVADVRAVIEAEGVPRATVVGHDWGGFVAWHTAMDAPECVERLIVLSMPHPWAIARELACNPAQRQASEYVKLFRHPQSHQQLPLERMSAWVHDAAYKPRQERAMQASSLHAMLNYYRVNWPVEPYAERGIAPPPVLAPTLLLHGLDDPYALPAGLNDVWAWVRRELTIHTLPGAGHFIQHEQADQVVRVMRAWLALTSAI